MSEKKETTLTTITRATKGAKTNAKINKHRNKHMKGNEWGEFGGALVI